MKPTAPQSLDGLEQFCTVRQLEILEALRKHGTQRAAAAALGCAKGLISGNLEMIRKKAALQGWSPAHDMTHIVPDGFKVKGVSTYYDDEGNPRGQWVKSMADAQRQAEMQRAAIEALQEEVKRLAPLPPPAATLGHLCTVYTLTDSHVGALAWNVETRTGDWDLTIAERVLVGCFEQMVLSSPRARTGIVAQLGDFLHYDSAIASVTPIHGHVLDADGRMPKMVKTAIRILRRVIDLALQHHERVVVLLAEGNHDISSSVWLRAMFQALYENESRVQVIDSELPYYAYQHGETMLFWHHGHLKKMEDLPLISAAQFPAIWGACRRRYAHCGHYHHKRVLELSGMTVTQHPTLAARDAHSARGGYISDQEATAMTYSDSKGLVATNTVCPEMLQ